MIRFSSWRRVARTACVPIVAAAVVGGLPLLAQTVGAAPASAAGLTVVPRSTTAVTSMVGAATVKTANGVSWTLIVGYSTDDSAVGIDLQRLVGGTSADELHEWSIPVKASTFKVSTSTGDATLKPGAETSPLATVSLSFKTSSRKAATCTTGSETEFLGKLSGEVLLVTGLTHGGTVKAVTFNIKGSESVVDVDKDCTVPIDDCTAGTVFEYAGPTGNPIAGGVYAVIGGKAFDGVTVETATNLKAPKGSLRIDGGVAFTKPATWNPGTHTLSATTSPSTFVTGSVTVSGKSKTMHVACSWKGKHYTLTETYNDFAATVTSPAGHALTAHLSLGGNITAALTS